MGHDWAYLPDAGETFALLANREGELQTFARFHFTGHWDPDGTAMTSALGRSVGRPDLKVKKLPWCLLKLMSSFNSSSRRVRYWVATCATSEISVLQRVSSLAKYVSNPQVTNLLDVLFAHAAQNDPLVHQAARESDAIGKSEADFFKAVNKAYMPVDRDFGNLLYSLVRSTKAKTVVEFGTSFGISTIFLTSAIRDHGTGKVITSEFEPEKAAQAKKNLAAAGLEDCVEFRVGYVLETMAIPPQEIDMIFLDGAKSLYLDVLKLLEPHLRSGGIVASDNTDHDGMEAFLTYIRDFRNGYTSAGIFTGGESGKAHEITIRH